MTMSERFADIYLNKRLAGIAINGCLFALPGLFLFALITSAFVILRQGIKSGLALVIGSSIFASLISFILFYIFAGSDSQDVALLNFTDLMLYYLGVSALIFILAAILRYTVSFKVTVHCMVFLFAFSTMAVVNISFVKEKLHSAVASQVERTVKKIQDPSTLSDSEVYDVDYQAKMQETVSSLKNISGKEFNNYYAYLILAFMVILFAVNFGLLCAARYWQSALFNPGGFATEFTEFKIYKLLLIIGVSVITTILEKFNIINLSSALNYTVFVGLQALYIVSFIVLLISGLAFVHWTVRTLNLSSMYLWMLYIMLFFVYTFIACVTALVLISICDSVIDLRKLVIKYKKG